MSTMSSNRTLVDVAELREELESRHSPVVLDARWALDPQHELAGRGGYVAGHIPGARFCDLETLLAGKPGRDGSGGRHPLPDPDAFERGMRALGVSDRTRVVVYDADGGFGAARAWWCLRYFGHPNVGFLDGGYRAWIEAGFAVESDVHAIEPGDFTVRPGEMPVLDAESAAELADRGLLLDARSQARYRGETEPIDPVAGHIPGAVSAPTVENDTAAGRFRAVEELCERFAGLGVDVDGSAKAGGGQVVGVYCGSGVSAAHQVLALELCGVPAALYVGSWSDWVSDPTRPVATGDET